MNENLVILYDRIARHTAPVCAETCFRPHSCCDSLYCQIAEASAERVGITLERTGNEALPFMGPNGCVVAPHLRPLCSLHTCGIEKWGFEPKLPREWTQEYFRLRKEIADEERPRATD